MLIEPTHICTSCHTQSVREIASTANLKTAATVTMIVGLVSVVLAPLFLVGLIWLICLIVADKPKCSACKKRTVISITTPRAQAILKGAEK